MAENLKIPSEILEPQILANAVNDLSFFMKIRQYLDTNNNEEKSFFSDIKYQEVFNLYSKFFEKFSKKPKKKTLLTLIDRTEEDDEVKLYKNSIVEKMYSTSNEEIDQEYIEEETVKFIKENRVYEAMISSQSDMETGNYDNILTKMEDAIKVSFDKDLGTSILDVDDVVNQLNEISSSHAISTGYPNLDSFLDGGFHGGELYSPAGIPGAGKCSRGDVKVVIEYEYDDETGEIL